MPRLQKTYDHRLRDLVRRTRDLTVATSAGVPRSTAAGWLRGPSRTTVTLNALGMNEQELQAEVVRSRRRVEKLRAVARILVAAARASGIDMARRRIPDGDSKAVLLRAVERARGTLRLRAALAMIGLSPSRFHSWRRAALGCDLEDHTSCRATNADPRHSGVRVLGGSCGTEAAALPHRRTAWMMDDEAMPRPQKTYDHRLRELVRRTQDPTVATSAGVPRSTAAGWLRGRDRTTATLDVLGMNEQVLQAEVVRLRLRVEKLRAVARILVAAIRAFGIDLARRRTPDGTVEVRHRTRGRARADVNPLPAPSIPTPEGGSPRWTVLLTPPRERKRPSRGRQDHV